MRSVVVLQINTHKLLIGRFAEKFRGSSFAAGWRDWLEGGARQGAGAEIMMQREG